MNPILALAAATFLSTIVMRMTDPVVPLLAAEFQVPASDLAHLATAYALPYALFQLVFGPLGDRYGKTTVVRFAVIMLSVFIAATALAPSFKTMMAARILSGAVGGAIIPLGLATIGDRYALPERQVMLSRFILSGILGQMAGGFLTGFMAEHMPWRWAFLVYAGLGGLVTFALFTVPKAQVSRSEEFSFGAIARRYAGIVARPSGRAVISTVFVEGALFFGILAFLPPYLAERRGFSAHDIGIVVAAYGIGSIAFTLVVRQLISLLGPYRMIAAGGLLGGLASFLFTVPAGVWFYAGLTTAIGFAFYLIHNNLQTRATELAPEARGSAVAIFACALFFGNGTGPALLHPVVTAYGYDAGFHVLTVVMVLFGLAAAVALHRVERARPAAPRAADQPKSSEVMSR